MSFISELKRRNVIRVAVVYAVASWVLLQVGDLLFGALGVPPWGIRLLLGLLILGFPLALIFAWVYELTPEGLKREQHVAPEASVTAHTARKLNLIVIVLLVCAVGLVTADRFLDHAGTTSVVSAAPSKAVNTPVWSPIYARNRLIEPATSPITLPIRSLSFDSSKGCVMIASPFRRLMHDAARACAIARCYRTA